MASRQGASPTKHLAAVAATGDTLVFLDAHCKPEPGALRRLVEGVEASDGRAIYTPTLIGLDADTFEPIPDQDGHGYRVDLSTLHCYWVPLDSLQRWPETQAYRQPALIGCCVAVSREAYFRCGGFDADMRCWGVEDIDFGLKADRLDYQLCLDPLARVAHRFQAAFTHYGVPSAEVQHNRLRMAWKHYSLGHLEQWLVYNTPFRLVDLTDPTRLETPDASWSPDWIAVLQQFHERKESADAERALLDRLSVRTALDYAADFGLTWPGEITEEARYAFGTAAPLMDSPNPSDGPKPSWGPSPSSSPCPCTITGVSVPTTVLVDQTVTVTITGTCLEGVTLTSHGMTIVSGPSGSTTEQTAEVKFDTYGTKSVHAQCGSSHVSAGTIVYQLDIKWKGNVVTGGDVSPVVVGQKVTLEAAWSPAVPPGVTYEWALPVRCVKDYVIDYNHNAGTNTTTTSGVITKRDQIDIKATTVTFHPYAAHSKETTGVTATMGDKTVLAETSISINPVHASLTGIVSSLPQCIEIIGQQIYCGQQNSGEHAIRLTGTVQPTPGHPGEVAFIQMIRTGRTDVYTDTEGVLHGTGTDTGGVYVLDRDPKEGQAHIAQYDSQKYNTSETATTPITVTDAPFGPVSEVNVSIDEEFRSYLMYKHADGIWITLKYLDWCWHAKATRDRPGHYVLSTVPGEVRPPGSPGASITSRSPFELHELMPTWTRRVVDCHVPYPLT